MIQIYSPSFSSRKLHTTIGDIASEANCGHFTHARSEKKLGPMSGARFQSLELSLGSPVQSRVLEYICNQMDRVKTIINYE
jgi:hypothetical protein